MKELRNIVKNEAPGLPLEIYSSSTYRRGLIGIESSVIISFVLAGIVGGILSTVGQEIWSAIKRIAIGALQYRDRSADMEFELITLRELDEKTTLIISCKSTSEDELEVFLSKAQKTIGEFLSNPNFRLSQSGPNFHIRILSDQQHLKQLRKEGENLMISEDNGQRG